MCGFVLAALGKKHTSWGVGLDDGGVACSRMQWGAVRGSGLRKSLEHQFPGVTLSDWVWEAAWSALLFQASPPADTHPAWTLPHLSAFLLASPVTVTFVRAGTVFLRLVGHSRCHLNKKSKHQVQKQVALVLLVMKETGAWCFLS